MPSGRWDEVVQEIRRIAGLSAAAHLPDRELIESFVSRGDEAAFEVLVRRYGPMVFSVCRRILRHTQDAEDAFQATFLLLVRKAATLRRGDAVASWLYEVAYRTALQARSSTARRRHKEAEARPMASEEPTLETAARLEMQALLDRELCRLPEKYRAPIVLCDLLGKTKKQAAEELRCPEGTVSSRLARGRELLKRRLAHHAPALTGPTGAILLQQTAGQGLPVGLCTATVKSAILVAKGTLTAAGGLSPTVAALMEGVVKSMLLTKLKPMVAVVFAVACLGTAALAIGTRMGDGEGNAAPAPAKAGNEMAAVAGPVAMPLGDKEQPKKEQPGNKEQPKKERKPPLTYGGKSFDDWRNVLLTELKPDLQIEALKAFRAFGVNGLAEEATVSILEVMKTYYGRVLEEDESRVVEAGKQALVGIGPKALTVVAKEVESKNVDDRRHAAKTVLPSFMRPFPAETFPLILRALKDDDKLVRASILVAHNMPERFPGGFLIDLPDAKKAAFALGLAAALNDEASESRLYAAMALNNLLGPDAKPATPALVKAVRDEDFYVRQAAFDALKSIGPEATVQAIPALIAAVKEEKDTEKRRLAVGQLGEIGRAAKQVEPLLINLYKTEQNASLRDQAIDTLLRIGPETEEAVPPLLAALKEEPKNSLHIIQTLGNMMPTAKEAVPRLLEIRDAKTFGNFTTDIVWQLNKAAKAALEKIQK